MTVTAMIGRLRRLQKRGLGTLDVYVCSDGDSNPELATGVIVADTRLGDCAVATRTIDIQTVVAITTY